jgi:hypothetical protein
MKNWMEQRDLLIEEALAFAQSVAADSCGGSQTSKQISNGFSESGRVFCRDHGQGPRQPIEN